MAPIIATWLLKVYGSWVPVAGYIVFAALVTLVAVFFMRETKGIDLSAIDEADRLATDGEVEAAKHLKMQK